jgi:hypothetical protein
MRLGAASKCFSYNDLPYLEQLAVPNVDAGCQARAGRIR